MRALRPLLVAAAAGLSVACATAATPAAGIDPARFLAQVRCADGALQVAEPRCAGAAPQKPGDRMQMRRHDWPGPTGYQIGDSFIAPGGAGYETIFSYPPFGPFIAANGDGGEIYRVDHGVVRIAATQDGGQMGVVQGFYGRQCGGSGWVLFGSDARTGRWTSLVAHLNGAPVGQACSAGNAAYTRYRLEQVSIPFIIGGARTARVLPTIISEHYDSESIAAAFAMERTFMAAGVGRAIWEAWSKGPPASHDTDQRCPGTAWSTPPAPGWTLSDCRYATNLVAEKGSMTGAAFGWPPAGLTLP